MKIMRVKQPDGTLVDIPIGISTDGKTPYIQDGYWYIDGVNTDVKAKGEDGTNGFSIYRSTENHPEKGEDIALDLSISEIETGGRALQVGDFVILDTYLYVITRLRYPSGADAALCFNMNGYTPIKGTDYYTEDDKAEMVQLVLASLPKVEEVGF